MLFKYFVNITNMTKLDIVKLKTIFSALANEKRIKIIELCSQKERNVTEISKMLNLNYSITVEYTSMLSKANLISKVRKEDRTVTIKPLIKLNNNGEIIKI